MPLRELILGTTAAAHRPYRRVVVDAVCWRDVSERLTAGDLTLLGLWGDAGMVHMAVLDESPGDIAVVTIEARDGRFPSVGVLHPPAIRLERAIASLFGLQPVGSPDGRPWLDLGFWGKKHPLAPTSGGASAPAILISTYEFLPVEGEGLHQIPVGPVHAGIIEPGHFRFTANGETVVRLEERLGYVHKGIESLMAGASIERGAQLAGRTSGDSTVAYALAFAHAVEAAWDICVPSHAVILRALMAELERMANHFGDVGAICNDASFALLHAECAVLRERVLRAADRCFGHRLMMDCVVPGGVARDLAPHGAVVIRELVREVRRAVPELVELYDNTASLQDRTVGTGVVAPALARQFGAGGYVGRASGRSFDARRQPGYAPYRELSFHIPILESGDVNARAWIRIRELEQSANLLEQLLQRLLDGATRAGIEPQSGVHEGLALVESFRGDVLVWLRLEGERISRCHLRDPSWFQWPLLEAAIEGNIVADFPLCNKSFNCSYSGHDL
ncbi:MAG TPA: hydrogenase expression protein HypE [Xanthobacteraceae bacterium]|jgi:Ni,Fe-hydrogenase III large subunit